MARRPNAAWLALLPALMLAGHALAQAVILKESEQKTEREAAKQAGKAASPFSLEVSAGLESDSNVSVSELDGHPVEIFASTAFDRDQHLQSRISNLTTITRLISLILRHIFLGERLTLEKTVTQLHRSSRQKSDLPEMLAQILGNYTRKQNPPSDKDIESP